MNISARLATHVTALITAGTGLSTTDATVIISGPVVINIPSTSAGVYLDVVTGQFGTSPATAPAGWDVNVWGTNALNLFTPTPSPGGGAYIGVGSFYTNIAIGMPIGPSSTFASTGTNTANPAAPLNNNSGNNLIGFRFVNEATGNQDHYGYFRLFLGASPGAQPRAIVEYGYEDQPGVAFGFPSPGTAGLFIVAALPLVRRRR